MREKRSWRCRAKSQPRGEGSVDAERAGPSPAEGSAKRSVERPAGEREGVGTALAGSAPRSGESSSSTQR